MDIGSLTGQIAIEDQMSGVMEMVSRKIESFVEGFDSAFGTIAIGAGAAVAAVGAVTAAITALGVKGSDINDLAGTMDTFSGSTARSEEILEKMSAGTKNTVGNMELMRDASKLLSTGALKNTADFEALTQASFALQNRGFGPTAEMVDRLSSALVTGRTRGIQQMVGIIDTTQALHDYADSLGKTVAELDKSELKHVTQLAILEKVRSLAKEGAEAQRDFGEEIEAAGKFVKDFVDDLAAQVAKSPDVMNAVHAIGDALKTAFGGDTKSAIAAIMGYINDFAKAVTATIPYIVKFGEGIAGTVKFLLDYREIIYGVLVAYAAWKISTLDIWTSIVKLSLQIEFTTAQMGLQEIATWALGVAQKALTLDVAAVNAGLKALWLTMMANPFIALAAAIGAITVATVEWYKSSSAAALKEEEAGAAMDVKNKALAAGIKYTDAYKDGVITLDEAIAFNNENFIKSGATALSISGAIKAVGNEHFATADKVKILNTAVLAASKTGDLNQKQWGLVADAMKEAGIKADDLAKSPALLSIANAMGIIKTQTDAATDAQKSKDKADKDAQKAAEDHAKAVTDLTKKLTEQVDSVKVTNEAFANLTQKQLANYDVQMKLIPLLTKQAQEQGYLNAAQQVALATSLDARDAHTKAQVEMLLANKTNQAYIQTLKDRGESEAEIAARLKVSTEALKKYNEVLKTRLDIFKLESSGPLKDFIGDLQKLGTAIPQKAFDDLSKYYTSLAMIERQGIANQQTAASLGSALESVGEKSNELVFVNAWLVKNAEAEKLNTDALQGMADGFAQLGQAAGGNLGAIFSGFGQMAVQLNNAHKASKQLGIDGTELGGKYGSLSTIFNDNANNTQKMAAGIQTAAAIAQGAAAVWDETSKHATAMGNAIGGAMQGAQAGAAFGPMGIAIGAAAGLVTGLIRGKPAWAKAASEVSRDFGTKISDELGKAIADSAKMDFGGSRQAAEVAHLGDIIKEAGGLSEANFPKMADRLHDVFSLISQGQMSVAQGSKVLEDNWASFAEAGTSASGLLRKDLVEIIKLQDQYGTNSKAIAEYVGTQGKAGVAGFGQAITIASNAMKSQQTDAEKLKDLHEQLGRAGADSQAGIQQQIDATTQHMEAQGAIVDATAIHSQQAFDAMSYGVGASFSAMIASGMSYAQAVTAIGPAIEGLTVQHDTLGFQSNAVYDLMKEQVALYSDAVAGPALSAVDGLSAGMVALDNMGKMNQGTFEALSSQIGVTFESLVAQGKDGDAVMMAMQGSLQKVWEEQQTYGYKTDETTQALIDQAVQEGIVGEKHMDASKQMLIATNKIVDILTVMATQLGATIPAAAETGAKGIQSSLNAIKAPDLHIKVAYDDPGFDSSSRVVKVQYQEEGKPSYAATGGLVTSHGVVQYLAGGGEVIPFAPRGTDTVPAMLTPGERVLSVEQNQTYENYMEGPSNEDVVNAVNGLRTDMTFKLPRALARSMHTGLVGIRTAS